MATYGCVFHAIVACFATVLLLGTSVSGEYYGKEIGSFGTRTQHGVRGTVIAASDRRLFIKGFSYDGSAPDAFVWMGSTASPSRTGEEIPVDGSKVPTKLGGYSDAVVQLDLPKSLSQYKWISIWCRRFAANFASVNIPDNFQTPREVSLGSLGFSRRVHNVHATNVVILNHRQIRIKNLDYDGNGPDAFYWAGTGSKPTSSGFALADESRSGSLSRIPSGGYNNRNVTLTIPENRGDIFSIGYVGLWCVDFKQDFGHVDIPSDQNVPPYGTEASGPTVPIPDYENCEVLIDDTFQARWTITGNMIEIALSARIDPGTYMAFGLSGSDSRTQMKGSDVTVTWIPDATQGMAKAVDYYLSEYQQCVIGSGSGACPDTDSIPAGSNDVTVGDFSDNNGIITIAYTRALNTSSTVGDDQVIPTDREVYLAWAIGPINPDGRAAKHRQAPSSDFKVDFGRTESSCPAFFSGDVEVLDPWVIPYLGRDTTEFQLDMGQAGGQQGYEGITKEPGWGIAWYVNKMIIPELRLKRNVTYTFTVNGGNDNTSQASYHPFYITDSSEGGFIQKTPMEQNSETIYAGPVEGSLCGWESTGTYNPDSFDTFVKYRDAALERQCLQPIESESFTFTPMEETPDDLYYQCYTHKFLGWKIKIVDDYTDSSLPTSRISILALFVSMLLAMIIM